MITRYQESTISIRIDAKARKLLALLAIDGRQTDAQIAKRARVSPESARYRIARLHEQGALQQIAPVIDIAALGWQRFHVFLLLDGKQRQTTELMQWLTAHAHTESVMEFTDTWDLRWSVHARNLQEYDLILRQLQSKFGESILDKLELAQLAHYDTMPLPQNFEPTLLKPSLCAPVTRIKLDDQDMIILHELSLDGRRSAYAIAKSTTVSSDTVLLRIRRLREAGIISRISIVCNLASFGFHWYTLALQFSRFTKDDEHKMHEFIAGHPHIIHAERTFGPWDAVLEIIADASAFHRTVKEIRKAFADFTRKYETWVAYREHLYAPLPVCVTRGRPELDHLH